MEETSPNPTNSSITEFETKMSKVADCILFLILSLIGAASILALVLFFQTLLLPQACTENPQSPIANFESQILEDFTELTKFLENVDAWLENNLNHNVKFVMEHLFVFLELAFVYHLLHSDSMYISQSAVAIFIFTMFLCVNGFFILVSTFQRYYFFQDSSEDCKIGLDIILQNLFQINCGSFFVLLAFIAFQHFLTKNCEK